MSRRPEWAVVPLYTVSNPAGAAVHDDCSINSATKENLPSGAVAELALQDLLSTPAPAHETSPRAPALARRSRRAG